VEGSNPGAHQPGGGGEIVVFGAERRPRRPWLGRLLLAGLVIAALVFVADHPSGQRAEHIATKLPTVSVTRLDLSILGISADWELFGLSTGRPGFDTVRARPDIPHLPVSGAP
jgi:hypothetical protein